MDGIKKYIKQVDNQIINNRACQVVINLDNYMREDIQIDKENGVIWFKSLICDIFFDNIKFAIILDYTMDVYIPEIIKETNQEIRIGYPVNSIVMETSLQKVEMTKQAQYVDRLLGGREIYKDTEHLFRRLYSIYEPLSDMDAVHLEVLLSNCLRDKSTPQLPARMGKKWDPVMMNIKNVVFNSGFVNGLAFENVNKAIETGITTETELPASILEKVMVGTIGEEK